MERLCNPFMRMDTQAARGDAAKLREDVLTSGAMEGEFRIAHCLKFSQPMTTVAL